MKLTKYSSSRQPRQSRPEVAYLLRQEDIEYAYNLDERQVAGLYLGLNLIVVWGKFCETPRSQLLEQSRQGTLSLHYSFVDADKIIKKERVRTSKRKPPYHSNDWLKTRFLELEELGFFKLLAPGGAIRGRRGYPPHVITQIDLGRILAFLELLESILFDKYNWRLYESKEDFGKPCVMPRHNCYANVLAYEHFFDSAWRRTGTELGVEIERRPDIRPYIVVRDTCPEKRDRSFADWLRRRGLAVVVTANRLGALFVSTIRGRPMVLAA